MMEFESSILELSIRKVKLLEEIKQLDREIQFLRKLQEEYDRNEYEFKCT
jgi:hypothetical protein